jgi:hypothetical protein
MREKTALIPYSVLAAQILSGSRIVDLNGSNDDIIACDTAVLGISSDAPNSYSVDVTGHRTPSESNHICAASGLFGPYQ